MVKKDLSIEYAHIYTNDKIGKEHELSVKILSSLKQDLQVKNQTFALTILIDDYSFPDPSFNYEDFSKWLTDKGYQPDIIFKESALIPLCELVLKEIKDEKLRNEIQEYIKMKKYPCSLFIATWYLLRLGYIKHVLFPGDLIADRLVNILPKSFKPFEDKGLEIISKTRFSEVTDKIHYQFFDGRPLSTDI